MVVYFFKNMVNMSIIVGYFIKNLVNGVQWFVFLQEFGKCEYNGCVFLQEYGKCKYHGCVFLQEC